MLKRIATMLLCVCILVCTGCTSAAEEKFHDLSNYVVKGVMKYPDYTFVSSPSSDEMRQMAMTAFKDVLSVRWSIATDITYTKTGPLSNKTFHYDADVTYAGLFYSSASSGLFQFLEFYDFETGRIYYPGDAEEFKETLGASCADAMLWGVSAVCNSISGPFYPVSMVYQNGYIPVGDYTYDPNTISFNYLPTPQIIKNNGKDVILDAYTKVVPGDMFTSSSANHGAMVVSSPVLKYAADGSIDLKNSYITLRDQRGGSSEGHYAVEEADGQVVLYTGCTYVDFTFEKLLDKGYIPVTTAEFAGTKPYEPCTVSIDKENCQTIDQLRSATISSNYGLAVVNLMVVNQSGNQTVVGRHLFNGANQGGVPREFALDQLEGLEHFESGPYSTAGYTVKVEVVPATGQRFIVAEFPMK